jgi:hypothetical protein
VAEPFLDLGDFGFMREGVACSRCAQRMNPQSTGIRAEAGSAALDCAGRSGFWTDRQSLAATAIHYALPLMNVEKKCQEKTGLDPSLREGCYRTQRSRPHREANLSGKPCHIPDLAREAFTVTIDERTKLMRGFFRLSVSIALAGFIGAVVVLFEFGNREDVFQLELLALLLMLFFVMVPLGLTILFRRWVTKGLQNQIS